MTVATGKGHLFSHLTYRSVHNAVPGLLEMPEVSLVTRQES